MAFALTYMLYCLDRMNTALRDAQKLYELLLANKDSLDTVLPKFSEERVREGNSLTDLAFHLYCIDTKFQFLETVHMVVRGSLSKWLPSIVSPHPQQLIGNPKYALADVYTLASTKMNIIRRHREINNRIRQEYFEKSVGMVPTESSAALGLGSFALVALVGAVGATVLHYV